MATMTARLEALEGKANPPGPKRVYCVIGDGEGESGRDFVRAEGYALDADDMVIHILGLEKSEDGLRYCGGNPMGWCGPLPPDKWRAAA